MGTLTVAGCLDAEFLLPSRRFVSGWLGTASIKWLGRIQVSRERLYSPYNTMEYILAGPHYRKTFPALGPPITRMPVTSMIDLDWPALVPPEPLIIRGRAYSGERAIREVHFKIDNGPWSPAEILFPVIPSSWVQWRFDWDPRPGEHEIRIRATDSAGDKQPETVPFNRLGYLYNAVVPHPVTVA